MLYRNHAVPSALHQDAPLMWFWFKDHHTDKDRNKHSQTVVVYTPILRIPLKIKTIKKNIHTAIGIKAFHVHPRRHAKICNAMMIAQPITEKPSLIKRFHGIFMQITTPSAQRAIVNAILSIFLSLMGSPYSTLVVFFHLLPDMIIDQMYIFFCGLDAFMSENNL